MNHAQLARSPRLKRVLAALREGGELSTMEIVRRAEVCAVNSCIAELRANGVAIDCRAAVIGGERRFFYRLAKASASETEVR